jgi:hypothetical protein
MGRTLTIIVLAVALSACGGSAPEVKAPANNVVSTQNIPASMRGVHAKQLFGKQEKSSRQWDEPFGGYAKGCMAGGVQLAETGPTWQAMRAGVERPLRGRHQPTARGADAFGASQPSDRDGYRHLDAPGGSVEPESL